MSHAFRTALAGLLLAVLVGPGDATADWLVLVDGQRVETRGPWRESGRRVIFTGRDGTVTSLAHDHVDWAATESANREPSTARATPAAAPRAVLVLEDGDVPRARREAEATEPAELPSEPALRVESWQRLDSPTGTTIAGILKNDTTSDHYRVRVEVLLEDHDGTVLARRLATLGRAALEPDAATSFEAGFDDLFNMAGARFLIDSVPLSRRDSASASRPNENDDRVPPDSPVQENS